MKINISVYKNSVYIFEISENKLCRKKILFTRQNGQSLLIIIKIIIAYSITLSRLIEWKWKIVYSSFCISMRDQLWAIHTYEKISFVAFISITNHDVVVGHLFALVFLFRIQGIIWLMKSSVTLLNFHHPTLS